MKTTTLILALFMFGCRSTKNEKYLYLNSKNRDSLIIGTYLINSKDTIYIKKIFENPYMRGITHKGQHYGKSIYVARMEMLHKISKLPPPNPISDEPDSAVINFYKKWAIENGYLSK